MNLWTEAVLPELGLSVGDEVIIPPHIEINRFKVTSNGLVDHEGHLDNMTTLGLINGTYAFEKLPWKPKAGEEYYRFNAIGGMTPTIFDPTNIFALMAVATGNYGRTADELKQKESEILKTLGLSEWIS